MATPEGNEDHAPLWRSGGDWTYIADIGGSDILARERVDAVLQAHHIEGGSEGSKCYHVFVAAGREQEATALLEADAAQHGYRIDFYRQDPA